MKIKEAAEALSRPYSTVYKLIKELGICPGEKYKDISIADLEIIREELGRRQERDTIGKTLDERLDTIEAELSKLIFVQESQKKAIEYIKERLGGR